MRMVVVVLSKPELHYINGEWMSKTKIIETFPVSGKSLTLKIVDSNGNDKVLEEWLNSIASMKIKSRRHFIDGEWMYRTDICRKYHRSIKTVNSLAEQSNGDDAVFNLLLKGYSSSNDSQSVHILNKTYKSITIASNKLGINTKTLRKILDSSSSQHELDCKVTNVLSSKYDSVSDKSTNRSMYGEDFEYIKDMYESNGLEWYADNIYRRYRKSNPEYKRSTFIKEYSLYQKLKQERVMALSEFEGTTLETGVLRMAKPIGDKVYYGVETIQNVFNIGKSTVTKVLKIADYKERLEFLSSFNKRNSEGVEFLEKYGKTKTEYAKENGISLKVLNSLLLKEGNLQENIRLYKEKSGVKVLNNLYKSQLSAILNYGLDSRIYYKYLNKNMSVNEAFYFTATNMLSDYFSGRNATKLGYDKIKFAYSYKGEAYYECRSVDEECEIRGNVELLTELYGAERVNKIQMCVRDYESIYCNGDSFKS